MPTKPMRVNFFTQVGASRRAQHAFTLVEVLIALAILAIALSAAVRAASVAVDSAHESKLRTLATWIAQDQIALASALVKTSGRLPPLSNTNDSNNRGSNDSQTSAGVDFGIQINISATPNPAFRKLEVRVLRPGDAQALVTMTSYLVSPPGAANAAKAAP